MARESLFLSSFGFNKFTHSNRQVAVQLPFRGDVSFLPPDAEGGVLLTLPLLAHFRRPGRRSSSSESPSALAGSIAAKRSSISGLNSAAIFARWTPNVPRISPCALKNVQLARFPGTDPAQPPTRLLPGCRRPC